MKEEFSLQMARYRDAEGVPACAANFQTGEVCQFYMTYNFGTKEICFFDMDSRLFRRKHGDGSLIPCEKCPVWKEKT